MLGLDVPIILLTLMDFQDSFCIYETAYCERNPEHIKMHSVHIQCANIDNGILSETRMWTFKVFFDMFDNHFLFTKAKMICIFDGQYPNKFYKNR